MSESSKLAGIVQSVAAVVAGMLAIIILSIGTDVAMSSIGAFPRQGASMSDAQYLIATVYRTVYAVIGGYIAARLAPNRPMRHALILGTLGLILGIVGVVTTWNTKPVIGHEWYPIALVVLALPPAWLGGKLREIEIRSKAGS